MRVRLIERNGDRVIFDELGRHAGLEVGGEVKLILDEWFTT